jgi:RNA-directed DNA polymerase
MGLPNYRLVRHADDFAAMVHGSRADAQAVKQDIARVLILQRACT